MLHPYKDNCSITAYSNKVRSIICNIEVCSVFYFYIIMDLLYSRYIVNNYILKLCLSKLDGMSHQAEI